MGVERAVRQRSVGTRLHTSLAEMPRTPKPYRPQHRTLAHFCRCNKNDELFWAIAADDLSDKSQ
jgi:hypothetical protein